MINLSVVTGYIPLANHPRSAREYSDLGATIYNPLHCALVPIISYMEQVHATWLNTSIRLLPYPVEPYIADNPQKNTLGYHCVQHQKFRWLCYAAYHNPTIDTFVWIDYGIGHVPGVTAEVIYKFLDRIKEDDFAIPGCWEKGIHSSDDLPNWRFCGGLLVVPRSKIDQLYSTVRRVALDKIVRTRKVTWEVNTLAEAEDELQPRWYYADHNQQMFENYQI